MNEFVSRNALLDAMPKNNELASLDVRKIICSVPAADVALVRHGRWIETDYFDAHKVPIYECSVCFREVADHYIKYHKYCLHCGAKMDAEEPTNE